MSVLDGIVEENRKMKQGVSSNLPPQEDQEARAVLNLYLAKGDEAFGLLLDNGRRMIADGSEDVASLFMDAAHRFRGFARQGGEPFWSVSAMLRRIAQRLHAEQPAEPADGRFLRLAVDNEGKASCG